MAAIMVHRISGGTEAAVKAFAEAAMDAWGVGKSSCNNGIVLAIAVQDKRMYIATGRGAAEYIQDKEVKAVTDRMKPLMRELRYDEAAEQSVSDIARILSGERFASAAGDQSSLVLGFISCVLAVVFASTCTKNRKYNRCKRALTQIEQERAQAKANQYQVTSCAICLESFAQTPKDETSLLCCGHTFHTNCVDGWQEARGTCPVCRRSTTETPGAEFNQPSATAPFQRPSSVNPSWNDEDEYRFRIRRARTLYPDYVSQSMVDRWCAPGYVGPVVADTSFIRASPSYKSSSAGSGSSSGSSSFGGGCSYGGGGAGGSW